ncbi:MAG: ankyrin repeat domain-containing protein [Gemmatimonadaceae bacterium]
MVCVVAAVVLCSAAVPFVSIGTEAPVADAAMKGDSATVVSLIRTGADVNAAQGDGMTALHWAAQRGDAGEAKMLVTAGARLDATTRNGNYTPLHLAARAGKPAVIKVLLAAGANPNATTTSGGATALHFAASEGNAESVAALIEKGANVNAKESSFGQTPIMWAAAANRVAVIQVLASKGADLSATSKVDNVPALDSAERAATLAYTRRIAAMRAAENPTSAPAAGGRAGQGAAGAPGGAATALPGPGGAPAGGGRGAGGAAAVARADSVAQAGGRGLSFGELVGNKGGLTPLIFAVREGNVDATNALLKAGANIDEVSAGDHSSPLLIATINGQFDIAKMLLDRGANPKLASDAGATPLYATINVQWIPKASYPQPKAQYNQKITYLEMMDALLSKGADPNVRLTKHLWYMSYVFDLLGVNTAGATPFWRAAYGLDVPAMKLLVAHGADPMVPTLKPAGRLQNPDASAQADTGTKKNDPSGLAPVPVGGPGVFPVHAASGAGYGEGFAANAHQHAPDAWLPAMKYLIEELHMDVNQRDFNGDTPLHNAAARGDDDLIMYLVSKGADVKAVSRSGQTVADMANGPVQRVPPFVGTVALLEKLGSKNSHACKSC